MYEFVFAARLPDIAYFCAERGR